jgi:hypothetical protein
VIEFKGSIDRQLYVRALRLQSGSVTTSTAVILIVVGLVILTTATPRDPSSWGIPLFLLLLGGFLIAMPLLIARKGLSTGKTIQAPFSGHADETELVIESEYGRSQLPWSSIYRVALTKDLALVYMSAHQFHIFARSFFKDDSDWTAFTDLAGRHVKQVRPRQTMVRSAILWFVIVIVVFVVWSFLKVD